MFKQSEDRLSLNLLILLALMADLILPFLIWKGIAPPFVRWLSHASIALMMMLAYARMMVQDRVPGIVWLTVGASAIWVCVALFNGQGLLPTGWGWWLMFQFPFVGLFAYLQPQWPENFSELLYKSNIGLIGLELIVQIGQYATGEPPGDNLAGFFGQNGTGDLGIFILLVLCLALGQWIAKRRWKDVLLVLILGVISSTLGEMKLFIIVGPLLVLIAAGLHLLRYHQVWRLIPRLFLLAAMVLGFIQLYDLVVPGAKDRPIELYLQDPEALAEYLNFTERDVANDRYYYNLGRNARLELGWNAISGDTMTLFFGMGLGARGDSVTLGTEGIGVQQGLGLVNNTSLLVMLQELGLGGIVVLGCLYVWLILTLFRDILADPESEATGLRYALFLFSLLWPLWLWYTTSWTVRVPMLLYWVMLAYVLSQAKRHETWRGKVSALRANLFRGQ